MAYETEFHPVETQILLDEKSHKAAVKASYQSNVKTIYFHLEEIINKILAHKTKWTSKYNGDLAKIAQGLVKHQANVKDKMEKYIDAKGKKGAADKLAALKGKSYNKAKAKLEAKKADADKERKALKGLYVKGLKQKEGEICMIRKIQCMVAKFNGEASLQKKYCGACEEKPPSSKVTEQGSINWTMKHGYCPGTNGEKEDGHGTGERSFSRPEGMSGPKFIEACKAKCTGSCRAFIIIYNANKKSSGVQKCNFKTGCNVKKYEGGDRDVVMRT